MTTLADELPRQMRRVREELIPAYQAIGSAGHFAIAFLNQDLREAEEAMAQQDTVRMIAACKKLQEAE